MADLRNVLLALQKRVHGVDGMIGPLECMQTRWKNDCLVAWQQSFKGRSKGSMSTITLEAAAHNNLVWFWHAGAYCFSGVLNDVNVLNLSPLLDRMTNGTFTALAESEAGVTPSSLTER
jgi:hypothetical protein